MSRKFHITSLDIFDTLMARGQRIGISGLIDIARQKFMLISKDDDRQRLAEYVSQLPFDHDDIVKLYEIIESDNRREKITTSQIRKKISSDQLFSAFEVLSTSIAPLGEKVTILSNPHSPTMIVEYEYKETDFGKATMLQETIRRDRIELSLDKTKTTDVRSIANEKCKALIEKLIQEIEKSAKEKIEVDEIELSHITDGKKRNDFFFSLINGIDGLALDDVSGVKISRMEEMNIEDEDLLEENEPESTEEEQVSTNKFAGFIKEVALRGRALLGQKEYLDFVEKGFFISNLVWKSLDTTVQPNLLVEFEAGFMDQQECKGFQYAVKGAYSYKKDDSGFSSTRKPLSEPDKLMYKAKMEEAARRSKKEISHDKG